jgi:outer membrane protein assembly factor BamB
MILIATLAFFLCVESAAPYHYPPTFGNVTLRWRTSVGCHRYGPGCWTPGFKGTDSSPASLEGRILVGSYDGNIYSIDPSNGTVQWKVEGPGGEDSPATSSSASTETYVWGGLQGKTLQSIDTATGSIKWTWSPPKNTSGSITTSGAVDDSLGLVFVGTSSSHKFSAVNTSNGKTVWTYESDARGDFWGTLGPLNAGASMVCVGAGGSADAYLNCSASIVCLDKSTGKVIWKQRTGKQIQSRPSKGATQLFVGDYGGHPLLLRNAFLCSSFSPVSNVPLWSFLSFCTQMAASTPSLSPMDASFGRRALVVS